MAQTNRNAVQVYDNSKDRQRVYQRACQAQTGKSKAQGSQLRDGERLILPTVEHLPHVVGESFYNDSPWYWIRFLTSTGRTVKVSINGFSKGLYLPENEGEVTLQKGKFAELQDRFKYGLDCWQFICWLADRQPDKRSEWVVSTYEVTELKWGSKTEEKDKPTPVKALNPTFNLSAAKWEEALKLYLEKYPDTEMAATAADDTNTDDAV